MKIDLERGTNTYDSTIHPVFLPLNLSEALVYIASDQIDGLPRQGYLEKIVKAAERLEFNSGYVRELKKWFHGKID